MLHRLTLTPIFAVLAMAGCSDDGAGPVADSRPPTTDHAPTDQAPPDGPAGDRSIQWDITVDPPVTLSVATWNVKNFFDENDDPAHQDDLPTAAEVKAKIKALGAALRQLKADVLALQEVENRQLLDRLVSEELSSLQYKHVRLLEGNDVRGIDVALLSRYPVPKAISHVKDVFKGVPPDTQNYGFSRDCLEATIEPAAGRRLILLINHLRASDGTNYQESVARREAQAQRVREIADATLAAHPDANLAVVGDLNDTPDSKTIQLLRDGAPALRDLLTLVPADQRYTHAKKSQLDYILAAPGLDSDLIQGSVRADHATVFGDTSDHFPVLARFKLE
jgi:endonuclease/exonuclease/phosphatase family metal-dependent hydrolase